MVTAGEIEYALRELDELVRQIGASLDDRASASERMGLALAIVERACARLGHGLDLLSRPGRGSVFRVTVPLAAAGARNSRDNGDPRHLSSLAGAGVDRGS